VTLLTLPPGGGRRFGPGLTAKLELGQSPDFAVFEGALLPESMGPPPHVHRNYDEAFYVLDGSVQFLSDAAPQVCAAGSFVFVPRGTVHGFTNPAVAPATVLVVTTPRAIELVERTYDFFDDQGRPTDVEAIQALWARHDTEVAGPPPS